MRNAGPQCLPDPDWQIGDGWGSRDNVGNWFQRNQIHRQESRSLDLEEEERLRQKRVAQEQEYEDEIKFLASCGLLSPFVESCVAVSGGFREAAKAQEVRQVEEDQVDSKIKYPWHQGPKVRQIHLILGK